MAVRIGDASFSQDGRSSTGQVILERTVCIFWRRDDVSVRAKYFLLGLSWDATGQTVASFPEGEVIAFSTTASILAELWRRQRLAQGPTMDNNSSTSTIIVDTDDDSDDDVKDTVQND